MSTPQAQVLQINLDRDAALVLFEFLSAREEHLVGALQLEAPERNALWQLEAALEKKLSEPFLSNYPELLAAARESLIRKGGE